MKKNKSNDQQKRSILQADVSFGRVSLSQKLVFAKDLSLMLRSGLVLSEALEIIEEQSTGKMKKVSQKVLQAVEAGEPLSEALSFFPKIFSPLFRNIVNAGELSGNLEKNLENIALQLKKENELIAKIKGAMYYPLTVMTAAFFLGLAMSFLVLPKITPLFEGLKVQLPWSTRVLISFSHIIGNYSYWLFFGIVAFVIFVIWFLRLRALRPFTNWFLLNAPVIKDIVIKTNLARFCSTLATLLQSGISIDNALDITNKTLENYYYKRALTKVSMHVSQGGKLSESLEEFSNIFPRITTRMIKVGEKSGNLDETLFYLAESYESEVDNATKSLSTLIEPVLLLGIGLLVAFLALSIITPIYQVTGNIRQ